MLRTSHEAVLYMTNCRKYFFSVYNLVGPPNLDPPTGMWVGMLMPVYNLCRNTLRNTRTSV